MPRNLPLIVVTAVLAAVATQALGLEQPVRLETATGTLHGTLDVPNSSAACPVVVIIAGSGPTDRDGNQPSMKNDSLKLLGQALAARGIAALRYDKRGIAESAAAAPREEDVRFETYVADVVQWVTWLRRDSRFSGVGLIGHSEGSLIGLLAAKQAKVDAFVSLAGSGRSADALIRKQLDNKLPPSLKTRSDHILAELVAGRTVTNVPNDLQTLYRPSVQPYLISWFKHDPVREMAGLEVPVLIVQGTTDLQVSVDDAQRLAAAKKDARLCLIDNMNHVLKHAATPTEQQAAYTDPSLPLEVVAVREITDFLTTEMASAAVTPSKVSVGHGRGQQRRFHGRVIDVSGPAGAKILYAFATKHWLQAMWVTWLNPTLKPPSRVPADVIDWLATHVLMFAIDPVDDAQGFAQESKINHGSHG